MDSHQGTERFNRIAATLFTKLYESIPDPSEITTEALGAMAAPLGSEPEDVVQYQKSAGHVVTWLAAEGMVRYQSSPYGAFLGVVLTMKALTVLGFVPKALRAAPVPLIDRLKTSLGKTASEAASDGIRRALGAVFDLALRYSQASPNLPLLSA